MFAVGEPAAPLPPPALSTHHERVGGNLLAGAGGNEPIHEHVVVALEGAVHALQRQAGAADWAVSSLRRKLAPASSNNPLAREQRARQGAAPGPGALRPRPAMQSRRTLAAVWRGPSGGELPERASPPWSEQAAARGWPWRGRAGARRTFTGCV